MEWWENDDYAPVGEGIARKDFSVFGNKGNVRGGSYEDINGNKRYGFGAGIGSNDINGSVSAKSARRAGYGAAGVAAAGAAYAGYKHYQKKKAEREAAAAQAATQKVPTRVKGNAASPGRYAQGQATGLANDMRPSRESWINDPGALSVMESYFSEFADADMYSDAQESYGYDDYGYGYDEGYGDAPNEWDQ